MAERQSLREELAGRWAGLWPQDIQPQLKPPLFPGRGKAAERLRRLPEYRRARVVAVLPDPVLLQVRINLLADNKTLLALTPGLKDGFVRVTAAMLPVPRRAVELRGGALKGAGKQLRLPEDRLGRVDMVVGACLAADGSGNLLGDGRGVWDLGAALLSAMGALTPQAVLAVLAADEQMVPEIAPQPWDAPAGMIVTPSEAIRTGAALAGPNLENLPPKLAGLPVVRAVKEAISF